jgi:excinuclease ABC subunit A
VVDGPTLTFSQHLACPLDGFSFEELQPRNFSFNSPYGACVDCSGIGTRFQVDPDLVIPDPDRSIGEGAVAPWSGNKMKYFQRMLEGIAEEMGFSLTTPWKDLPAKVRKAILEGTGERKIRVSYANRFGRKREYSATYEGVLPFLSRRHEGAESDNAREYYEEYMREVPCDTCSGGRLNPVSMAVTIAGMGIHRLSSMSLGETHRFLERIELTEREAAIAERVLKEIRARLRFLLDVGLEYLTLARSAATLAGGEAQRIRLATQIGSGLVGVLYILDEPSIGLHQRDNQRLIETLIRLRDLGNTLIVVEHDEDTIRVADHIVDIGPGAGEHGGFVVAQGTFADLCSATDSVTGDYLAGRRRIEVPAHPTDRERQCDQGGGSHREQPPQRRRVHPARIVRGRHRSVGVRQVDPGRGHPLQGTPQKIYRSRSNPGRHKKIEGIEHIDKVINIDQSPIGRTPRSNPATYTGLFDHIRTLFSSTNEARARGYQPGSVLVQRLRWPLRGMCRRRHHQDRDALPPRRVRAL